MGHDETTAAFQGGASPSPSDSGEAGSWGPIAGEMIGPYHLLAVLGRGGFGIVWLAERREPMVQRVALKVLKPGMDSRAVILRFEQERQALAVMDHPNVAKVFDGGVTGASRGNLPYFVMEYVPGEPITTFCDRHRLTLRERLELFIPVCEAVQHAHHKGIIHRDLKPSNILVSSVNDHGVPKVIDFGVSKAISHTLTDGTIYTEAGQIIGTPEYMSPEQAEMGRLDIDTRADVYSLGVVLYELLAGVLPFDTQTLRKAGYAEIQRIIRNEEAPRPSTRLSTLDNVTAGSIARTRQHGREQLEGTLRRELEWIPMKALRKDRTRRYASAEALAQDVRRYLKGQPLDAGPESRAYHARKLVSRYRPEFIAGLCVVLALLAGGIASSISLARARQLVRELQAERDLRNELDRLDQLVRQAQFDRGNESAITAALEAANGLERLLGPADRRTLSARAMHANMYFAAGRLAEGKPLYEACVRDRIERLGPGDEWTIGVMNEYADLLYEMGSSEAEDAVLHAADLARRFATPGNATRDRTLWRAGNLLLENDRFVEAEPYFRALVDSIPLRDPPANPEELPAARERLDACVLRASGLPSR